MAHVGVKRLAAGDRQHNRAEGKKAFPGMASQKLKRIERVEGRQNSGRLQNAEQAEQTKYAKPRAHDRAEEATHHASPMFLNRKQRG